jgi:WD40 repeat protein
VCWHKFDPEIFGSVSDDHTVALWDTRNKSSTPIHSILAHSRDIYSIDFNPFDSNLFLTGSADKTVGLWDIRNLGKKLLSFEAHSEDVLKVFLIYILG